MKTGDADIDVMMDTLGHDVADDPIHPLSMAQRWRCRKCDEAVLKYEGHIYGEATKAVCKPKERR